jgi:uncharacterized repeat protein (TIGR03803 family)
MDILRYLPKLVFQLRIYPLIATVTTAFMLTVVVLQAAQAQSFVALHEFTGGQDGLAPVAGLAMDKAGNLYGTTQGGGGGGHGTVFKMTHKAGGWLFGPLYGFTGGKDGGDPLAAVTIGRDGTLYGTTAVGGEGTGCNGSCGTVFNLRPAPHASPNVFAPWTEAVLYSFAGGMDGGGPNFGDLVFDQSGNIYVATWEGGGSGCGGYGCGTVVKLTPSTGGSWTESVLYSFGGGNDGSRPIAVIFDQAGNLYGTANTGGMYGCGTVFELTPSGSGWAENTLYQFNPNIGDGCNPQAGLIFDASGNLYGTNANGGVQGGGTAFQLSPNGQGSWTENVLYAFTSGLGYGGPFGALTLDDAGNLYGTDYGGGAYGLGAVFKLTPSGSNWIYTSLHDFINYADGEFPVGNVTLDAKGDAYGTASLGGQYGYGVVWEITP